MKARPFVFVLMLAVLLAALPATAEDLKAIVVKIVDGEDHRPCRGDEGVQIEKSVQSGFGAIQRCWY